VFGLDEGRTTALVMLIVFGSFTVYGLLAEKTRFYRAYSRSAQPMAYWSIVALWAFMTFVGGYRFVVGFPQP
jgi:hypothetical protein